MCFTVAHAVVSISFERESYTVSESDGQLNETVFVVRGGDVLSELNQTVLVELDMGGSSTQGQLTCRVT